MFQGWMSSILGFRDGVGGRPVAGARDRLGNVEKTGFQEGRASISVRRETGSERPIGRESMREVKEIMDDTSTEGTEIRFLIRGVIEEFVRAEQVKSEPAYKAELIDERRRREELETRVNEFVKENQRTRQVADERRKYVDSYGATTTGRRQSRSGLPRGERRCQTQRRRTAGWSRGSGRGSTARLSRADSYRRIQNSCRLASPGVGHGVGNESAGGTVRSDLDKIRPGMSEEELTKVRQEISRVANQAMRGF